MKGETRDEFVQRLLSECPTYFALPVYEASLWRNPIGWGFTVRRDGYVIGHCSGLLTIFYRSRADALNAATKLAQHDKDSYRVRLPV